MFIKTINGDLINSQFIGRIYIEPDGEDEEYSCTDVVAEMTGALFDETLASFSNDGDNELDLDDAKDFVRLLESRLNQQNVFVVNHILPVANCEG